ncbi:toxin glutamine deamidase domain-containing protein [Fannyhessea vaginae]|uniref:toxin glutamine deamidase domain-containing protein n=1 Tax=Fannyhessea vaginae TaxID=82135 RepID=UPI0026EFC6E5|nr:toxin glutamine deamidase domain-containing protein [Fannyhessea vaginae]
MGAFHGAKTDVVGARTRKKAEENLVNKMKSFGDGSRAIVRVQWNGNAGGHVFNAEYKNGKMFYRDAQTGKSVNTQHYLSMARPQSVGLVRTNNLKLSYRIRNFVTQTRR